MHNKSNTIYARFTELRTIVGDGSVFKRWKHPNADSHGKQCHKPSLITFATNQWNATYMCCVQTVEAYYRFAMKTSPLFHTSPGATRWSPEVTALALATPRLFRIGAWTRLKEQPPQNTSAATKLELVCCNLTAPCQIQTLTTLTVHRLVHQPNFPDVCSKDGRLLSMHNKSNTICARFTELHTLVGARYRKYHLQALRL